MSTRSEPADGDPVRVDARGRRCPLPIIDLAQAARMIERARDEHPLEGGSRPGGELIELWADDPAAATDVAAWCAMRNHDLVAAMPLEDERAPAVPAGPPAPTTTRYLIRLNSPRTAPS